MKKLLLLSLPILVLIAPANVAAICHKPHQKHHKVVKASQTIVRDTLHIPVYVFDTVRVSLPTPQFVYDEKQLIAYYVQNNVSFPQRDEFQPVPAPSQSPDSRPTVNFQPFLEAGLHGESHSAANWMAGLGIDLTHGPIELECAAMIEPTIPVPGATTTPEQTALDRNATTMAIRTVVYGTLKFLF